MLCDKPPKPLSGFLGCGWVWICPTRFSSHFRAQEEKAGPSAASPLRVEGRRGYLRPLRAIACTPSTVTSAHIPGCKASLVTKPGVSEAGKLAPPTGNHGEGGDAEGRGTVTKSYDFLLTPDSQVKGPSYGNICPPPD